MSTFGPVEAIVLRSTFGPLELVVLLLIALLVFGPKRLPALGRSLGRGLREFKDAVSGSDGDPPEEDRKQSEPPPVKRPDDLGADPEHSRSDRAAD